MDCMVPERLIGVGRRLLGLSKACDGTTAVETAIVLPAFVLMLFAIIEGGLLFWTQSTLQFAVEAAARCAALAAVNTAQCGSTSAIQSYAVTQATGITVSSTSFNVSQPSCGYQVSISYSYNFILTYLYAGTITLNAQSCHP
jgi:Flp pilus assembly protein TadG